jgi:uncharacterized protein YjbI with pentapeptide repeats
VLRARSLAEAKLFVAEQPCPKCGARGFAEPSRLVERGGALAVACEGYCPRCGALRVFELGLAEARVPPNAWGNADASTLIDAGEWMALADRWAEGVPVTPADAPARARARADLARAIAALGEVVKFIPDGADAPPKSAFFTSPGREVYLADPRRFARARVVVVVEAWRDLARELDREYAAPVARKARTYHELLLYMEQHPCPTCGTVATPSQLDRDTTYTSDTRALDVYAGPCPKCSTPLRYEFDIPRAAFPPGFSYGGDEPSELFTAAEWRAMAERFASGAPDDPSTLAPKMFYDIIGRLERAKLMLGEAKKLAPGDASAIDARAAELQPLLDRYVREVPAMHARSRAEPAPPPKIEFTKDAVAAHAAWLARGKSGAGRLVLEGTSLGGMTLGDLKVQGARFVDVSFDKCRLDFARFDDAELVGCRAVATNFARANLDRATFERCRFERATMVLSDMRDARVTGGDWREVDADRGAWQRSKFSHVDFQNARFGDCALDAARFEDCDLRGADLARRTQLPAAATTHNASFVRCDLRGAKLDGRRLDGTRFLDCKLDDAVSEIIARRGKPPE